MELGGWDNTTFRLGEELAARLPSDEAYVPQVEKEQRWLPFLAQHVPLAIPQPVARGEPSGAFPRPWSVYAWLAGDPATPDRVVELERFAHDLADFLGALYRVDPTGGPVTGAHSFFRGGPLATYDDQTRATISALRDEIDTRAATALWDDALAATWSGPPVWVHGDVTGANLLVVDGRLRAVIDFGCCAVGDPACDLAVAWTLFTGPSRRAFRERLAVDEEAWRRGRGWALWKALLTLARGRDEQERTRRRFGWRVAARGVVDDLLAEP